MLKVARKDRTFFKSYGPLVVYLDDLAEFFHIANAEQVEISNDRFKFESVDEVREHYGDVVIHDLKLDTMRPNAVLTFSRLDAKLFVGASPTSAQLYHDLDELLSKCQRKPKRLYGFWICFIPLAISGISYTPLNPTIEGFPVLLLPVAIVGCWAMWVTFVTLRRHSVLVLRRRHEARNFLQRNRDAIGMNILSAIGGSILTLVVTYFKAKWFP